MNRSGKRLFILKYERRAANARFICTSFSPKLNNMKNVIIRYGLISGGIAALLMICTALYYHNASDWSGGEIIGYAGILLSLVFVFLGVRAYREQRAGQAFGFGKAFQVGLLITLISCALYVVAWMLVYEILMPDFMEKYADHMLASLRASGASEAVIQQQTAKMAEYKAMYQNPFVRIALTFIEPFPMGLLVTVISALILKRPAPSAA